MAPIAVEPYVRREIGKREPRPYALQLDAVGSAPQVCARARTLQANRYRILSLERHPAKLHIAKPGNSVRTPVLVGVRENIRIDKIAPVLAAAEVAQFSVSVSQAKSSLTGIDASAE